MFRVTLSIVALAGSLAAAHYASAAHRASHAAVQSEPTEQPMIPAPVSARPLPHPLVPGATDADTVPVGIGWG